jgi:hypothetical protein
MPWARIGELVGHDDLMTTARTYTHVVADEAELDYDALRECASEHARRKANLARYFGAPIRISDKQRFGVSQAVSAAQASSTRPSMLCWGSRIASPVSRSIFKTPVNPNGTWPVISRIAVPSGSIRVRSAPTSLNV